MVKLSPGLSVKTLSCDSVVELSPLDFKSWVLGGATSALWNKGTPSCLKRNILTARSFAIKHIVWKLLKMSHLNFWILAFSTNFCPSKTYLSGTTVSRQASSFQKLAKMNHFRHFWLTFVTQNVNVARFARNVEWDFLCNFQTQCQHF